MRNFNPVYKKYMIIKKNKVKEIIKKTPLFAPLKLAAALIGHSSFPMPFSATIPAEPFLDRAIARIGKNPDPARREEEFYSYFSEIWSEGYEKGLTQQYSAYLPYIPKRSDLPFLDIGCGAGEFIQFLSANGIRTQGIDSNSKEVARAKGYGLEVNQADALVYLQDHHACFSGISMLEVIEHLPPESLVSLLSTIFKSLAPGGVVLLETINIKHPLAFHSFYSDPTHTRPVPSDLLVFLLQWQGFTGVQVIYTTPLAFTQQQAIDPSRAYFSYAVLGIKPTVSI
ncbi:class I SAM-dependent methyltransferase [Acidithiobacillus thiooxidans]|uniref:class I SAM-dependent methyltransferase n=1 Tax=Acidithiobacillus thiooxidans TaxID=930 RepID=UPI00285B5264|nr:class I SAM-dependent methyltransferase [Acidithiobacillus thiooxidans]MDR7927476.1 class I SAM-dependent methyltransferase [Acidithiobacillus thiooxidans]